jgi:hypothetical protein
MSDTDTTTHDTHDPVIRRGHDEMNLAQFPVALLRREDMGRESYRYEGSIVLPDGVRHHQTWEIRAGNDGMPTEFDERVLVALLSISGEQNFQSRKVVFSIYQVLRVMQAENQGQTIHNRVIQALDRLAGTRIVTEGSFWDNSTKTWEPYRGNFGIVDEVWLRFRETDAEKKRQEGNAPGYFEWSKQIWRSIKSGYVKYLDLNIYYQLKTPIARRLYRLLDMRLHKDATFELDIFELAGKLAMSDTYKFAADIWRKLVPGINELKSIGMLEDANRKKVGRHTRVVFTRAQGHSIITLASNPAINSGSDDSDELRQELQELGMDAATAYALTDEYEVVYIREKLGQLRKALRRHARTIHNPVGWLVSAIRNDFTAHQNRLPLTDIRVDAPPAEATEGESTLERLWKQVLHHLELSVTRATFDTHFRNLQLLALDREVATIAVADEFRLEWIENRLKPQVAYALAAVTGNEVDLNFVKPDVRL